MGARRKANQDGFVRTMARLFVPAIQRERTERVELRDAGHGYDEFGANRDWIAFGLAITRGLYDFWFRVESQGHEHIPAQGAAILAANHSGTLPFDATMLWADIVRHSDPPRVARFLADHFVPNLPFISTLYTRTGAIGGSRNNLARLLESGELVCVFPEGTPGIGKHFRDRYQLQDWRPGHAELALRHRVPVVPVGIVGAEEQMPQIGRIPLAFGLFGAPYLPVTLTPVPLPVRYHIRYGPPLSLHERFDPERASEPEVARQAAAVVADAVRELVAQGLRERKGIFR
jgi:1-acyl-sn-glycerol-3-phosphate acyltransferase